MAKAKKSKASATAASKKKAGAKTTGEDIIDLIVRLALPAVSSSHQQPANESYRTANSPNNQPNLYIIPRQVIMQSTNKEVPTVSPKTTATMHDYFKPADAKKAADVKRGQRLKKRKSIANESIHLDR